MKLIKTFKSINYHNTRLRLRYYKYYVQCIECYKYTHVIEYSKYGIFWNKIDQNKLSKLIKLPKLSDPWCLTLKEGVSIMNTIGNTFSTKEIYQRIN